MVGEEKALERHHRDATDLACAGGACEKGDLCRDLKSRLRWLDDVRKWWIVKASR